MPLSVARGLRFRPETPADLPFLEALYASTRAEELAVVPWSEAEKAEFLAQQFRAQHAHYRQHYPDAVWSIVMHSGTDIGRLYLQRRAEEHRIIDIALLPEWRGQGFGAALMRDLMDQAATMTRTVSIHVEHNNPALTLYRRLGFEMLEDKGVYQLMTWRPA
jgi:ribosomal protein S18 acetylase RimI-like enzyme